MRQIQLFVALLWLGGCCRTINGMDTGGNSTSTGTGTTTAGDACAPATFTVSAGPLTPRTSLGAAFGSDGLAYIAGGTMFDGQPTALVEVLNPVTGTVSTGPAMLAARSGFSLIASRDGGTLYAIGGVDSDGGSVGPESFEVATQTWSALPELPDAGAPLVTTVLADGRVLAIVSDDRSADGGLSTWTLEPGGWQPGPQIPIPLPYYAPTAAASSGMGPVVYLVDDQLQLIAWDSASDGGDSSVVAVHHWPSQPSISGDLTDFSFAQVGHSLFVTGGLIFAFDCPYRIGNVAVDLDDLDAGWTPVDGLLPTRDMATTAVSPDQQLYLFGGETSSWCCTGHSTDLSRDYLGSFEVYARDAGP